MNTLRETIEEAKIVAKDMKTSLEGYGEKDG